MLIGRVGESSSLNCEPVTVLQGMSNLRNQRKIQKNNQQQVTRGQAAVSSMAQQRISRQFDFCYKCGEDSHISLTCKAHENPSLCCLGTHENVKSGLLKGPPKSEKMCGPKTKGKMGRGSESNCQNFPTGLVDLQTEVPVNAWQFYTVALK